MPSTVTYSPWQSHTESIREPNMSSTTQLVSITSSHHYRLFYQHQPGEAGHYRLPAGKKTTTTQHECHHHLQRHIKTVQLSVSTSRTSNVSEWSSSHCHATLTPPTGMIGLEAKEGGVNVPRQVTPPQN